MRQRYFFYHLFGAVLIASIITSCSLSFPLGDTLRTPEVTGAVDGNEPNPINTDQPSGGPTALPAIQTPESIPPTNEVIFKPLSHHAPDCGYGGELKAIEALDETTVRFRLCRPDVAFLAKIAFPAFGVLPKEFLEKTGGTGTELFQSPIGTGAYQVERWQTGEALFFSKFDGYWGGSQQGAEELVFRWDLDDSQRLLELQIGTAQGIDHPNPQDLTAIQSDLNLIWIERPPLSVVFLGMNNTYPPLDNQLVRKAISLAIDRQTIVDEFFPPGFKLATHFTPCVIPNGCVGESWYPYDPPQAKALLAEAGFPDGFETQLSYRNVVRGYLPEPESIAEQIRVQLRENLNINARLSPIDSPEFLTAADEGRLPGLFLLGWGADYADISNFLDPHFGGSATRMFGEPFSDVRAAVEQGKTMLDESARRPYYETANHAIREHVPMIPLAFGGWISPETLSSAFHRSVQGAHTNPFGLERFSEMGLEEPGPFVWMQSYEPFSLYCADETDPDTLRACAQVVEPLYRFVKDGARVEPALAETCQANTELTEWVCKLKPNIQFHDGSLLDANDVVMSFVVQWDAAHPLHKGRTGEFAYFVELLGPLLNDK